MVTSVRVNIVGIRHASSSSTFFFSLFFFLKDEKKKNNNHSSGKRNASTSRDGVHRACIRRSSGECGDVQKPWVACMGHHNAEAAWEDERHKNHHRDDAEGESLPSGDAGECDVRNHHNSPDAGERGNARDSRVDCNHHGVEGISGHSHQWEDSLCGESEPDKVPGKHGHLGVGSKIDMRISFQAFPGRLRALTSGTQVTLAPLNSRPSSFSTAVFRSLAVSNSTNLCLILVLMGVLDFPCGNEDSNPPSSEFTAGFRVNYIEPRLTAEVFEILKKGHVVSPSVGES